MSHSATDYARLGAEYEANMTGILLDLADLTEIPDLFRIEIIFAFSPVS